MKLLEYEAKAILKVAGIATPESWVVRASDDTAPNLPVVLKSQVPTGGRGKAGGIVVVENKDEYGGVVKRLFSLSIKGFTPHVLLAEQRLEIDRELYISVLVDKSAAQIMLMAHTNGGVEVEENPEDSYHKVVINSDASFDAIGQQLADYFDLADKTFVLQELVEKLYNCLVKNDALLVEINPLVLTKAGEIVAGDCKMELDDAAVFRHPDWNFETKSAETNFVTLDPRGNVATIANGAGLAMATVDAVADAGMVPANFLDVGGGANTASVLAAFQKIMEYPDVRVIVINIFAGITRCDEVARAIIAAQEQISDLPPLAIRLAGTNFEQAAELLQAESIPVLATLEECLAQAKQVVS